MMHCVQFGWNWLSSSWEEVSLLLKKYFNCCSRCFMAEILRIRLKTLSNQSTNCCICICHYLLIYYLFALIAPSLVGVSLIVLEKRFINFVYVISFLSPFWKRMWSKSNPHHTKILCAKFGWNWPYGSGEDFVFNFVSVFLLFPY